VDSLSDASTQTFILAMDKFGYDTTELHATSFFCFNHMQRKNREKAAHHGRSVKNFFYRPSRDFPGRLSLIFRVFPQLPCSRKKTCKMSTCRSF